ncbi:hypothetical protein L596_016423 [Steinernema carpocapsae]|uniref:SXP/RAL-2 family protein Ani s 5-like cation-binding domain-containing protein n=1 Tax=Steinernema carpocapsae TaxID=34508 RepID=A0A4U5NIV5_STECR|nr:hypothetical protein L596_016423 [Steinernema carpocapsae]
MIWKLVIFGSFVALVAAVAQNETERIQEDLQDEMNLITLPPMPDSKNYNPFDNLIAENSTGILLSIPTTTPFYNNKSKIDQWKEKIKGVGSKIRGWWHKAKDKVSEKFGIVKNKMNQAAHSVKDYFHNVTEPIRQGWREMKDEMHNRSKVHEAEIEAFKETVLTEPSDSPDKNDSNLSDSMKTQHVLIQESQSKHFQEHDEVQEIEKPFDDHDSALSDFMDTQSHSEPDNVTSDHPSSTKDHNKASSDHFSHPKNLHK